MRWSGEEFAGGFRKNKKPSLSGGPFDFTMMRERNIQNA